MTAIVPLLMMWLWSQRGAPRSREPAWPTPASPPPMPPIPAFQSQAPPPAMAHADAQSTPLSELHKNPPVAPHADASSPAKAAAKILKSRVKAPSLPSFLKGAAQKSAAVQDLQTILIKRGVKLTRDGLYGPKTASAWSTLARSKGLDSKISRVGPKVARVNMATYDMLSVPAIP